MIELLMKSSSGEPYTVSVDNEGGPVSIFCTCQAGVLGQMCKHKAGVILGDPKLLYDKVQIVQFEDAVRACAPAIRPLYEAMLVEMADFDAEEVKIMETVAPFLEDLKKRRAAVRGAFARQITQGVT